MVGAEDVVYLYKTLNDNGIQVWLTGGWGIDALLGEHTRPHKDLDVIMLVDDVVTMRKLLIRHGYRLKELWEENLCTIDVHGTRLATAFVLRDAGEHELDVHAMRLDERGNGIPAWDKERGFIYTPQDLAGQGIVAGHTVHCMSADNQMTSHTGYELPDKQVPDPIRLHEKFGIEYPQKLTGLLKSTVSSVKN